ncbi:MAG: type I-B CRISPR-associated protein Cas8b1/Cst1 [Eubacterium sp.]|nr:type I-B CRISPR-associated protein Cas8b1/Cst1 [Gallibacter sp.]MDY6038203.1 type I-B CRISPR-associated protein Cas8b1/Cst1 [Eubacterium sp.]
MDEIIKLSHGDWLYNCGILGLYNILSHNSDVEGMVLGQDTFEFPISAIEGMADKYFEYFMDTYEKTFSMYRIISFKSFLDKHENSNFKEFDKNSLEGLNAQIEQTKKYMKSNSYVSAYSLIKSEFKPLDEEKKLKKIILKKNENIQDRIADIKLQVELLRNIINFFERDDSRKYIGAKNAMYSVINNSWGNISFLNRQVKNPDMYSEYDSYFIKPVKEYLNISEKELTNSKYRCISCNSKIKNLDIDLGFIKEIGFDVKRKTSHVWDFNNYVGICPICRLVYACVSAGFTYLYDRGIFVNYSMDLRELYRINTRIKNDVLQSMDNNTVVYRALQKQMDYMTNENTSFELADIQVVRFKRDKEKIKYSFSILSKSMLKTVKECKLQLEKIRNAYFSEGEERIYVYNEVIQRLFNNSNQFSLIHKLIYNKLSMPESSKYTMDTVSNILKINLQFLKEVGYMAKDEKKDRNVISMAELQGKKLQNFYNQFGGIYESGLSDYANDMQKKNGEKKYNKKLDSIAYRMLNALRTDNKFLFMDTMIKAYMYAKKEIPTIFAEHLGESDYQEFKIIGYAFITGMLGISKNNQYDEKKEEK